MQAVHAAAEANYEQRLDGAYASKNTRAAASSLMRLHGAYASKNTRAAASSLMRLDGADASNKTCADTSASIEELASKKTRAAASSSMEELAGALSYVSLNSSPLMARRRKLLVLDCNGLLVHRERRGGGRNGLASKTPSHEPSVRSGAYVIYARPWLHNFIAWCSERFVLVVWTTAMRRNAEPLVNLAFRDSDPPIATLNQSECTFTGEMHSVNRHKPLVLKRLEAVWNHPHIVGLGFGPADTLLLDDSPYKAARNPADTALHPREWSIKETDPEIENALGPAGEIRRALALVAEAQDVRHAVQRLNMEPSKHWVRPADDALFAMLRDKPLPMQEGNLTVSSRPPERSGKGGAEGEAPARLPEVRPVGADMRKAALRS